MSDTSRETVSVPSSALKAGDMLAQDIGSYDNFKKGTTLTPSLIEQLERLMGQNPVSVERETAAKNNESGEKNAVRTADANDISDLISERINAAFNKQKEEITRDNLTEYSSVYNLDMSDMDSADQAEAAKIINSIDEISKQISELESGPKHTKETIRLRLQERVQLIDNVYTGLLNARQEAVKALEKITLAFLEETGPNRDASILLKDIMDQKSNFLGNHSLNVAIVSLAAAIELTKIMEQKLNNKDISKDLKVLRAIKFKSFSREELVKLGFAAFVHDLYLKKVFPHLQWNDKFETQREKSQIERHASESYHIMKQFEMDYHVNKAVLQHHERMDGTGYPDGITGRMFSKYTALISFADRYVSLTQPNPFSPTLHPTAAIKRMLTVEKSGFDSDVMIAFARAATMIPIGSWVQIEDGKIGYSSRPIPGSNLPQIRLVMGPDGSKLDEPTETDPSFPGQRIDKLLTKEIVKKINPNFEELYIL